MTFVALELALVLFKIRDVPGLVRPRCWYLATVNDRREQRFPFKCCGMHACKIYGAVLGNYLVEEEQGKVNREGNMLHWCTAQRDI